MRVRRHRGISRRLRLLGNRLDEFDQLALKLVDGIAHKETQIGRDLLVTAAAGVKLEPDFSSKFDQPTLKEVVNVFGFAVLHELRIAFSVLDMFQSIEQRFQLSSAEHTGARERTSVRAAGRDLLWEKSFIERKRPLPLLEFRIQRPAKPA